MMEKNEERMKYNHSSTSCLMTFVFVFCFSGKDYGCQIRLKERERKGFRGESEEGRYMERR